MCGRYSLSAPGDVIAESFDLDAVPDLFPRYNIAPTQEVAALRAEGPGKDRKLVLLRWGLIPRWAADPSIGNRMINARAETVADKPAFRWAFKRQRCLVLADGYYEWKKAEDGTKQPYFIRLAGGGPFAFAGLWERWDKEGQPIESCTLVTTEPNEVSGAIHNRMPVILSRRDFDLWLDPEVTEAERLTPLLVSYQAGPMEAWPVSRLVNSPANDSPRCVEPSD